MAPDARSKGSRDREGHPGQIRSKVWAAGPGCARGPPHGGAALAVRLGVRTESDPGLLPGLDRIVELGLEVGYGRLRTAARPLKAAHLAHRSARFELILEANRLDCPCDRNA